jgi:hypothetical protein
MKCVAGYYQQTGGLPGQSDFQDAACRFIPPVRKVTCTLGSLLWAHLVSRESLHAGHLKIAEGRLKAGSNIKHHTTVSFAQ